MVPKKQDSVVWDQIKKKTQIETRLKKLEKQTNRKYEQKQAEN